MLDAKFYALLYTCDAHSNVQHTRLHMHTPMSHYAFAQITRVLQLSSNLRKHCFKFNEFVVNVFGRKCYIS